MEEGETRQRTSRVREWKSRRRRGRAECHQRCGSLTRGKGQGTRTEIGELVRVCPFNWAASPGARRPDRTDARILSLLIIVSALTSLYQH